MLYSGFGMPPVLGESSMKKLWMYRVNALAVILAFCVMALAPAGGIRAAAVKGQLRIALICSGSVTDGGWNQEGKNAILAVKKKLHAHVSILEHISPVRAVDVMRSYAMRGYNLIIGHGYEFLIPATEVAAMGGKTRFAVSGADTTKPGVLTLNFDLAQPSYQLGILAAMLSKTGKIGFIGGEAIPSVVACYRGFAAGARSVNPKIKVAEAYTSWDQPALSKSQAQAFIQQGIDVIYQNVDAASRGVFEAVAQANQSHGAPVYVFGSNSDQNNNPTCSRYTPASAVIRLDRAFLRVARAVQQGTFKPGVATENLRNHVCIVVLNPRLVGSVITPAMQKAIARAGRELLSGKVHVKP
jgi:basic membrane lipoprotein Med (substrate-binding protein (PBP1-ABC) superfamily)